MARVVPGWRWVPPADFSTGAEVADLNRAAGFAPDVNQRELLVDAFGVRGGLKAALEVAVVAPRQNLKSAFGEMAALGWLFLDEAPLTVWTAHEFKTCQEAFRNLSNRIDSHDFLRKRVKKITRGTGEEAIETTAGARLLFKTRTKTGARGLAGDRVILDEAFRLSAEQVGALFPLVTAKPDPQILYLSSAGMVSSEVLRVLRDRGRAGDDDLLCYSEWGDVEPGGCQALDCSHVVGAVEGCALDDEARWGRVMPSLGDRITLRVVRQLRKAMPPEEFAREFLGWWDDPVKGEESDVALWHAGRSDDVASGTLGWALDCSPGLAWSSVAVAGNGVVEIVEHRRDHDWLDERLLELQDRYDIEFFVVDPQGPVGAVLPRLQSAGVRLRLLDGKDTVRACGMVESGLEKGEIRHRGDEALMSAVVGSKRRRVGDGWKWSRRDSTVNIAPLVAATYALWASSLLSIRSSEPVVHFV